MTTIENIKNILRPIVYAAPNWLRGRRRAKALRAERPAIDQTRLVEDLLALPIPDGAAVLVHSSLKSLGFVEGGGAAVAAALVEAFVERKGGAVMLPAFSIDGSMHKTLTAGKVFDVTSTPSTMGAIPEAFRRRADAVRSVHPTHSFAAAGAGATDLVADHHVCGTSFGAGSPMAKLRDGRGWLLGLGSDLGKVTFYHCLEDLEPDYPMPVYTSDSPFEAACRDAEGVTHHLKVNAHNPELATHRIDRPDSTALRSYFTRRFEARAGLEWGRVGEAPAWTARADRFYEEARAMLHEGITVYTSADDLAALTRNRDDGEAE